MWVRNSKCLLSVDTLRVFVIALCIAPLMNCAFINANDPVVGDIPPATVIASREASLIVRIGDRSCSATKVSNELLLSAAHCVFGYSGEESYGPIYIKRRGQSLYFEIAEHGEFKPSLGKMEDWVLFRPIDEPNALSGIGTATLASSAEIERMIRTLSDEIDEKKYPVWTISFPSYAFRAYPRTPILTKRQFLLRGFLKSDFAYKTSVALAWKDKLIYDDRSPLPNSGAVDEAETIWASAGNNPVKHNCERYHKNGTPIVYHSADYAPGSSGGGVFDETTGKLLGLIPMGASVISRRNGYPGFGQLYRIDYVCSQSKLLRKSNVKCE